MQRTHRLLAGLAVAAVLAGGAGVAGAAEIVEHSITYGTVSLPFTTNFGQTYIVPAAPAPGDTFVDDYGFIISDASFSSIVATFDLGSVLSISGLSMRLFSGDPWSGAIPGYLSAADLAYRAANTVAVGTGSGSVESILPVVLMPGHYVLEISGGVDGSFGGSYGGVVNLVPVPEVSAGAMSLAGMVMLGLLALRRRSV